MAYEREKCLRLLEEQGRAIPLDKLLASRGKFYQLSGWMDKIEDKDQLIRALTVQFDELTLEVQEFREELNYTRQGLEDIEEELRQWDLPSSVEQT